jgi:hypothetical protein
LNTVIDLSFVVKSGPSGKRR